MNFYWSNAKAEVSGPVSQDTLVALHDKGAVTDATPVIAEGESAWRTYGDFFPPAWAPPHPPNAAKPPPDKQAFSAALKGAWIGVCVATTIVYRSSADFTFVERLLICVILGAILGAVSFLITYVIAIIIYTARR